MAERHDIIPPNDADFDSWLKNLVEGVEEKTGGQPAAWTHIPPGEITLLSGAYTDWRAAYEPTLRPHLPSDTLAKKEARKAAESVIRPFVGQWLVWKQVSDKEREDLGLHNPAPRRAQIPAPSTVPELSPRAGNPRQVVVSYRDSGSPHKGKPRDVHGIEVRWAILEHPPVNVNGLTNSAFDTNSPPTLEFDEQDRGKRVYMAGCWEIEREGVKGGYGEIVSAVIP